MPFTAPTFEEIHQLGVDLAAKLLPGDDTSEGSYLWRKTGVQAGLVTDNHVHIATATDELLPDRAVGAGLDRWGRLLNLPRKGATGARKADALRLTGTEGSPFTAGVTLVHESGLRYAINESGTIPAAGYVDVDVVAIDKGGATRLAAGEQLVFLESVTGIADEAELQLALDEDGEDAEQDGAYQNRLLDRLRKPPLGGATNDYLQWAKEVAGVADAYVYPLRAGLGTVDVVGLARGSGTARALNATERAALLAYLTSKRPVGVAGLRVLEVAAQPFDVEVTIRPRESRYAFDWDDQTPPIVSAWNAPTRTLTLTADRPPTLTAGARIVIATAGGTGAAITVESLPVTATQLVLESVPAAPPVAGNAVYAGGPLTEPARAAIQALIDQLGTANPDDARFGEWEGSARVLDLGKAVGNVAGVFTPLVIAPAADVAASNPAYPLDGTIGLLVAGRILVRKRW